MTTSLTRDCLLDRVENEAFPVEVRAYFQQRLYNKVHQLLLRLLDEEEGKKNNFSKRALAKKIGKKPEQITRWLSYPGNMTLDTLSDLALGFECEFAVDAKEICSRVITIHSHRHLHGYVSISFSEDSSEMKSPYNACVVSTSVRDNRGFKLEGVILCQK